MRGFERFRFTLRGAGLGASSLTLVLLFVAGCGSEKSEAAKFCKILTLQSDTIDRVNAQENTLMAQMDAWAGRIAFGGLGMNLGGPAPLPFLQQTNMLISQLDPVSKTLEINAVKAAYLQTQKAAIQNDLKMRLAYLGSIAALLQTANSNWRGNNFTVPNGIPQLSTQLRTYAPSQGNPLAAAVTAIRTKYEITDSDLR
jgi:hypothetical protein